MDKTDKTWVRYKNTIPTSKYECFYCGDRLNNYNRTVDHLHPKSQGGIRSNDNKVYSCRRCNQFKSDSTIPVFKGMIEFLIKEMEQDFDSKMSYYRKVYEKLKLVEAVKKDNEQKRNPDNTASGVREDQPSQDNG